MNSWQDWLTGLLGVYLVVSGFVTSLQQSQYNLIITGLLIAILGFWSANAS